MLGTTRTYANILKQRVKKTIDLAVMFCVAAQLAHLPPSMYMHILGLVVAPALPGLGDDEGMRGN